MNIYLSETPSDVVEACDLLSQGELVVIPTETVYGLAADATNTQAVVGIYTLKERPHFNPLIIHVDSLDMALEYGVFSKKALNFVERCWFEHKIPLTVVVKKRDHPVPLSPLVSAGLDTIAIRYPHHEKTRCLIRCFKKPLAAPSANPSNQLSPTCPQMVRRGFLDKTPFILEGGRCSIGIESTIVDMSTDTPVLLRFGGAEIVELESLLGQVLPMMSADLVIRAPGQLKFHYAPKKPLRINCQTPDPKDFWIGFGASFIDHPFSKSLSSKGCLQEASRNFFYVLFEADEDPNTQSISVAPIPHEGLGYAINDRLLRATGAVSC